MPSLAPVDFIKTDLNLLATATGRIVVIVNDNGKMGPAGRKLDRLSKGALKRFIESDHFKEMKCGEGCDLAWPAGLEAEAIHIIKIDHRIEARNARNAGAAAGKNLSPIGTLVLADNIKYAAELAFGLTLRSYRFDLYKTADKKTPGPVQIMVTSPEISSSEAGPLVALAEGIYFTRDLVNEPANVLTTTEFAARLAQMNDLGLTVEILDEADLEKIGMRTLLAVGQGSASPSKVAVMSWRGGELDAAPLALIGKGVVFDTGGISIKPAAGMEDMTCDMGGAATVAGVMRTLALRRAPANVVGIVGLVENMPDGAAQRPGDIIKSLKGDTIEVINTDAEGRLVLADLLWYVQERFAPRAIIDLATLTGAIVVALGAENTGVFSNHDQFCSQFMKAAKAENEGAWRMPMGEGYDEKLKSRLADMMNVGGREGGAITAAQFLKRFVKHDMPWIHLDIAGTALLKTDSLYAPKGATGWGVMALNRLIKDRFER